MKPLENLKPPTPEEHDLLMAINPVLAQRNSNTLTYSDANAYGGNPMEYTKARQVLAVIRPLVEDRERLRSLSDLGDRLEAEMKRHGEHLARLQEENDRLVRELNERIAAEASEGSRISKAAVDLLSGGCEKHTGLPFDEFVRLGGGGCTLCAQASAERLREAALGAAGYLGWAGRHGDEDAARYAKRLDLALRAER